MIDPLKAKKKMLERRLREDHYYSETGRNWAPIAAQEELEEFASKLEKNKRSRAETETKIARGISSKFSAGASSYKRSNFARQRTGYDEVIKRIANLRFLEAQRLVAGRKIRAHLPARFRKKFMSFVSDGVWGKKR